MSAIARPPFPHRLLAWPALLLAAGFLLADAPRQAAGERGPLTVVYVGADDCGPCRAWRRGERPAFLDSAEFARLHYREVIAPHLRELVAAHDWPDDLAALRERVRARPGAPQWFILREGRTIASEAGLSAWHSRVWPVIRAEARHDPALPH